MQQKARPEKKKTKTKTKTKQKTKQNKTKQNKTNKQNKTKTFLFVHNTLKLRNHMLLRSVKWSFLLLIT